MNDAVVDQMEALQSIDEHGFYLIRDVVSKDKLARLDEQLKAAYEQELRDGVLFKGGGRISGHLNCFPGEGSRFVLEDMRSHGVLDVIGEMSPTAVDRLRINCNLNLPNSVAQHYHIDGYYSDEFFLCTIAVIDTDLANGALDVLPGTHRRPYKYWQHALGREYKRTTRVPMGQGDVLIRKSTVWHRGMPNRSAAPRAQLTFTFGESIAPTSDPFLVNDGKISFWPNWYSTGLRGRIRELVRVKAPMINSANRFVWSLIGKEI